MAMGTNQKVHPEASRQTGFFKDVTGVGASTCRGFWRRIGSRGASPASVWQQAIDLRNINYGATFNTVK